ncbi:MAG TPA: PspA/IM30 family protein [Anaerohalosphaeraceae bacterium]|jgi:phage shock protein A|nr:PspA/IM30 family protein [Anaerohalosphaeraceae bacterium]HRT50146.1 PspA/IM30 family protein [Anaerohalosphaeraceae bacterium]HRT86080.1 PspA/IM30 family protein [Anaerohalosphaeraceae bacterium]
MSIFERIQRIAKANVNWLLDKAEPAEQELASKIKELEETLLEGRESAATYGATFRRLETEMQQLQQKQADLTAQAETALKAGDETAARKALAEKVRLAERIAQMKPGLDRGRQTFEMLRDNMIKLQEQLKAAKLKFEDLKARKRTAEAQKAFDKHLSRAVAFNPDGVTFDRLEDQVLQSEAEVQINQELRGDSLTEIELAQRARDMQVEAELAELRERLNQGKAG